jgi:hypothetical protein
MTPTTKASPTELPNGSLVPLESVLCTEELNLRPSRLPDSETENRVLDMLLVAAIPKRPRGNGSISCAAARYHPYGPQAPGSRGIEVILAIRAEFAGARIIVLTMFEGDVEIK